ncbi:uncharacterized protein FIESC28_08442 [Fusarium coffeatum]|uniref:Rhodanese domain-containing protein n=1 Tax=Fusarium coffeatum TaxID=231269 RepID=A0A366R7L4_9HYPO|nr:uncharacterized protein FIESC28_08442 [Fusarium coffeatum]RBR12852.1 hypothetical protein FIESC28_08442 [Fusarium coffeatum]
MPSKTSFTKHLRFHKKKKQETDEFKPTPAQEPAKSTANKTPDILERYASRRMNLRRSPSPEPVDEGQSDPVYANVLGAGHHYVMGAGRHYVTDLDGGFGGWAGAEYNEGNGHDDSGGSSGSTSASGPDRVDDNSSVASDLNTLDFKKNFHDDLLKAIQNINSTGKFAFCTKYRAPSDLSISIDGVGNIATPLAESQARQIITKARQAPYGKGTETFVDTSVRNTWELDPSQFTIISAMWRNYPPNACAKAAEQMGINKPVRAKLYKMLLYDEGAMFKPHTDTEKIPGMFGTLVISLPSKHTGGEVVMKHCGEKMIYKSSDYHTSIAAWYSDVSHEVLPVTSGYRWVLTYNLAIDKSLPAPSAPLGRSELRPPRHCIRRWLAQDKKSRQSPYTYHMLEYEYTEANISYKTLKAQDLARVTALREACNGLPVTIFLALVEKMERGSVMANPLGWYNESDEESDEGGHCIEDVLESSLAVKFLQDLNGQVVPGKMFIKEDHLLQPFTFDSLDPDKEDYERHTGNAGAQATHWYFLGQGVVIVPHDSIGGFFRQSQSEYGCQPEEFPQTQINYLAQLCCKPDAQDYLITTMVNLVKRAVPHIEKQRHILTDTSVMPNVLKASLQHGKYVLAETILSKLSGYLPYEWYSWLREWLIRDDGEARALKRFDKVKRGLSIAMSSDDKLDHKFDATAHLVPLPKDLPPNAIPTPKFIKDWAQQNIRKFLDGHGLKEATTQDGLSLVNMSLYFEDPILFMKESVVPIFEKQTAAPSFRFKILSRLMVLMADGTLPSTEVVALSQTMARMLIASQDFTLLRDAKVIGAQEKKRKAEPWMDDDRDLSRIRQVRSQLRNAITWETLRNFFLFLHKLGDLRDQFMTKVNKQAHKLPAVELFSMWIPFLQSSVEILEVEKTPLTTPSYQKFFSTLILTMLKGYLGSEPQGSVNWSMVGVDCWCEDCERLNAFLAHPTRISARYPMSKQRRFHFHQEIQAAHVACTHVTERNTNPNTMVVTKTGRPEEVKLQDWRKRRDQCAAKFAKFEAEDLKTLLGSDYAKIERLGPRPAQTTTSQSPAAGEKRAADNAPEVIDLTSE